MIGSAVELVDCPSLPVEKMWKPRPTVIFVRAEERLSVKIVKRKATQPNTQRNAKVD